MALPLFHSLSHFPSCLLSSAPFFPPFPAALHLFKRFLFFPSPISCFFSFLSLSPFSIIPLITSPDLLLLALRARKFRVLCFVLDGSRGFRRNQCFLPGKGASFRGRPANTLSSTALQSRSRGLAWEKPAGAFLSWNPVPDCPCSRVLRCLCGCRWRGPSAFFLCCCQRDTEKTQTGKLVLSSSLKTDKILLRVF